MEKVKIGDEVLIRCTVMSLPNEEGSFNAVPSRCQDGGASWQWVNTADIATKEGDTK